MQISKQDLDRMIHEEINELFGFGKKEPSKEYPASEMATITSTLFALAKKANVEQTEQSRNTMVDELEKALAQQGYKLHEQDLILGDELTIDIGSMPTLAKMIGDILQAIPEAEALITKAFKRGGITLGSQPGASAPSTSVEEYPGDEMTTMLNVLFSTAKKNGIEVDGDRRQAIIDEFYKVLEKQGVTIAEQKLELGGDLSLKIDEESMPETTRLVWTMIGRNPDVRERLTRLFARGGITLEIGDKISDALWDQVRSDNFDASTRTARKAKPEPDEDQTATIKAEPVAAPDDEEIPAPGSDELSSSVATLSSPEDLEATIKAPPVSGPAPGDAEEEDIPSILTVADPEEEEESAMDATLDKIQAALDIAGLAGLTVAGEVVGTPATVASLALNTARGKYPMALLDVIALVPVVGKMAKAGKLGKAAMVGATAAKWKTGRALISTLGSASAARGAATAASSAGKSVIAAKQLKQGASGIVEMLPDALLKQVVLAKTDEGKPWVDHAIDTVGELPIPGLELEEKAAKLRDLWTDVKEEYWSNEPIEPFPVLKEHKEFNRMKVLAGIK